MRQLTPKRLAKKSARRYIGKHTQALIFSNSALQWTAAALFVSVYFHFTWCRFFLLSIGAFISLSGIEKGWNPNLYVFVMQIGLQKDEKKREQFA